MTALAPTPEVARPAARTRWDAVEAGLAVAAFAVLCVLVLKAAPYLPEPDDSAYRASIVAMTDGHFLTLSAAQAHTLAMQLAPHIGGGGLRGHDDLIGLVRVRPCQRRIVPPHFGPRPFRMSQKVEVVNRHHPGRRS